MRYLIGLLLCASLWGQGNEVITARRRGAAPSGTTFATVTWHIGTISGTPTNLACAVDYTVD
jgi:uncharacterized protein YbjT (DUF2867 family)